ncbi:MAG TPA: class I SAM-dependent methyltransferase [Terriglobales bacterium]|nr:class I SAM-dependent methyltransferase [Terriglobales bacterium]
MSGGSPVVTTIAPTITPTIDRQLSGSGSIPRRVSVEEGYARWAATYDQTPNPLLALEQRCLLPLIPDLAGKRVLDLACGTGRWLEKLLAAKPASGFGIDSSAAMLAMAQEKAAMTGRLARADCLQLPFPSDVFDLAICSFAVEHIRNMSEVAAEWSRVLKQSADLFITGLHPAAYATGWRAGFRDGQDALQIDAVPHSAMEMVAVFCHAGFELGHTMECFVGEPEHPLFAHAGKERLFDAARGVPAIMISHFRRCSRASELHPPGIDCLVLEG